MIMPLSDRTAPPSHIDDSDTTKIPVPTSPERTKSHPPRSPSPSRPTPAPSSATSEPKIDSDPTPTSPKPDQKDASPPPPPSAEQVKETADTDVPVPQSAIDMDIFQQILDLDEDTHEFSRGMTLEYFTQVESTFKEMDEALTRRDLAELSTLGHFLKGSSAALGVSKVQASCEKIQHYGQLRDEQKGKDLSNEEALDLISKLLSQVKKEYIEAERWLMGWYAAHPDPE